MRKTRQKRSSLQRIRFSIVHVCEKVNGYFAERLLYNVSMKKSIQDKTEVAKESGREIFNHIVVFFTVGAVFGTYWEEILWLFKGLFEHGELIWVSRRGLLYGPFSPVYGIGAVLIYLLFYRTKLKPLACFGLGAVFGGVLEFVLSVMQEWLFGTISWDYSTYPLNIMGRTTIPYMVIWGGLVWAFVTYVYPFIDKIYHQIAKRSMNTFCVVMAVILLLDAGISLAATIRQAQRRAGDPADNIVERILDEVYTDERIKATYDNAKYIRDQK